MRKTFLSSALILAFALTMPSMATNINEIDDEMLSTYRQSVRGRNEEAPVSQNISAPEESRQEASFVRKTCGNLAYCGTVAATTMLATGLSLATVRSSTSYIDTTEYGLEGGYAPLSVATRNAYMGLSVGLVAGYILASYIKEAIIHRRVTPVPFLTR